MIGSHNRKVQLVLCLALILGSGCQKQAEEQSQTGDPSKKPPPAVSHENATKKYTVRHSITQPGYIEAFEQTAIVAKIPGYVHKVYVDIGDQIQGPKHDEHAKKRKPGTLLAKLSVPDMEADVKKNEALVSKTAEEIEQSKVLVKVMEAKLQSAESHVKEAEAAIIRAQADYDRWKIELARFEGLTTSGVIDKQNLDVVRYQFDAAKAGREETKAKIHTAKAAVAEYEAQLLKAKVDVPVAEARHKAAQADHDYSTALLGYTEFEAPYDGVVIQRSVNTGDFVQPSAGMKGQPLFVVARTDAVRIFIDVPETDALWVKPGASATIRVRGIKGQSFVGTVARTSWGLSQTARTLRTEINLKNKDSLFRPGMYAHATITVEHENVWTLPAEAVFTENEQYSCYRVEDGKVVLTPLHIGLSGGKRIEVSKREVRSGDQALWVDFDGNETIVTSNPQALKDGQTVSLKR